jgi:thiol-disulfide isomerase/thioredoxin
LFHAILGFSACRSLIAAVTPIVVTLFTFALPVQAADTKLLPWSGALPSAFVLQDSHGAEQTLASRRGTVTLVHFFATWCEPCREELPALRRLSERAGSSLNIVAISVAEVDPRVKRFLETVPLNFPVLMDRDRAVARNWNVTTLPTTVVLDRNLQPRLVVETDFAWDMLEPAQLFKQIAAAPGLQTIAAQSKGPKP